MARGFRVVSDSLKGTNDFRGLDSWRRLPYFSPARKNSADSDRHEENNKTDLKSLRFSTISPKVVHHQRLSFRRLIEFDSRRLQTSLSVSRSLPAVAFGEGGPQRSTQSYVWRAKTLEAPEADRIAQFTQN